MDTAAQPVSAQVVGNAFVQQYYQILHQSPEQVHKFYKDISKLGRPEKDGTISVTSTMNAINDKILSLNDDDYCAEISSVDAQDSYEGGVHVLVTGYLTRKDGTLQNFAQTFFLAPQEAGFFVLNDILRYLEVASIHAGNHARANEVVVVSVAPEPALADHPPVVENRIPEQSTSSAEVYKPPENGDVPVIVAEEVPVPEVVDEVQDDSHMVVELNTNIEVVSKKSYASIVKHLKESAAKFSPPPAPPKPLPKSQDQVNQPIASGTDGHNVVENVNSQNGEADSYSVYIKGLPLNTTYDMLHDEFKKFGPIKEGGIQVRNNKGFVFGFVEFEVGSAVEKAIEVITSDVTAPMERNQYVILTTPENMHNILEGHGAWASPIVIGGRQAVVEEKREKRSTYSRGNTRGRFIPAGFRNEGMRGRGSYGGGRGYRTANRNTPLIPTTSSSRGDST